MVELFVYGGPQTEEEIHNNSGKEVVVYIDSIHYSGGPLDDLTFDDGPESIYPSHFIEGTAGEVDWVE